MGFDFFYKVFQGTTKFLYLITGGSRADREAAASAPASNPTPQRLTPFQWGELALMFFAIVMTFRLLREVFV